MRVLVWTDLPAGSPTYPEGIGEAIAAAVCAGGADVRTASIDDPEQGIAAATLAETDVLVWWAHLRHSEVEDERAALVQRAVLRGMGLVVLHSAAHAKPFLALMGTTCAFRWREGDDRELIWCVDPSHPIAAGVPEAIDLGRHEMYGEPFDIPAPEELVFVSGFSGGEVLRSGCCFRRGDGRIFYFSPGHQTEPVYRHPDVARVLGNAVAWAAGDRRRRPADRTPVHAPVPAFEARL